METKKIKATIKFTIDKDHPDIYSVEDWTEDKVFEYSDTYNVSGNNLGWVKTDLKLVAGGGYDYNHIHNVEFEIKEIK